MMAHGFVFQGGGLFWMLIFGAIVVVPFWRLLPQYGIPSWVALFAIFPFAPLVLLWIMAFRDRISGGQP